MQLLIQGIGMTFEYILGQSTLCKVFVEFSTWDFRCRSYIDTHHIGRKGFGMNELASSRHIIQLICEFG